MPWPCRPALPSEEQLDLTSSCPEAPDAGCRIGFGVSGPHATPLLSPVQTKQLVRRAFEGGIRMFDTSPSYGDGEAERRLGEALQDLPRNECVLSSKVGHRRASGGGLIRDFSPDGVRRSIDGSLSRLQTPYIDWLFLHGPAHEELTDPLLQTLETEVRAGRIRHIGVAGRGSEVEAALTTGLMSLAMTPVNAGLGTESVSALGRLHASGARIVGIETLAPALRRGIAPPTAGGVFRLMRAAAMRSRPDPQVRMSLAGALSWALAPGRAHHALTTTSSLSHLNEILKAHETLSADA